MTTDDRRPMRDMQQFSAKGQQSTTPQPSAVGDQRSVVVSVLMPTFKHAMFIRRALESLFAQTFTQWELVILDDGSPDNTARMVDPFLSDPRVRYYRRERNGGLGAALNDATALARGHYIAYLPSDDLYYPDHLARLVTLLESRPTVALAYGGVRYGYKYEAPLPSMSDRAEPLPPSNPEPHKENPSSGPNHLAPCLVQVMHRRSHEPELRWPTRDEIETDTLEADFWKALLERGGEAAYTGAMTCEWVDHYNQRHKILTSNQGGLARYRRHYGLGVGEWVNWAPTHGIHVDERARYWHLVAPRILPTANKLKILLVGELGFNPERILAFEERGHKLYGLWVPQPEPWDTTGPLPFGNVEDIPVAPGWVERVQAAQPDVIYALLNWQALSLIEQVLDANLGIPIVFHFKEGPFICHERGLWPILVRVLAESAGQVFINQESFEWFQLATGGLLDPTHAFILDGDLPKIDWFTNEWSPKLSSKDGEIHTVCPGRPLGLDPFEAIAAAGIHVHFYGRHFQRQFPNWTRNGLATGYMHLHPAVEPADWTRELSQYDAAWFHVFGSDNHGDLRRARWDDLNIPARLGTYAAAGLPWILKDNRHSRVAVQHMAQHHDVGIFFKDFNDLAAQLRDRQRVAELTENMRATRHLFAFDTHVDGLIDFFQQAMTRR